MAPRVNAVSWPSFRADPKGPGPESIAPMPDGSIESENRAFRDLRMAGSRLNRAPRNARFHRSAFFERTRRLI
jgi:hypothetical protein